MALDQQIRALFGGADKLPSLPTSVSGMREFYKARKLPGQTVGPVASVHDLSIPGPGEPLDLRVYTPLGDGLHPLLVYFHGGGFVAGSLDSLDANSRNFCSRASCVVVSVDYRLAPEHRFPAATDDALAAVRWAGEHASAIGADPNCLIVGGESAGGNLATVTALRVRDEGGPHLAGQMLIYAPTDHPSRTTQSLVDNGENYLLTRASMEFFYDQYLRGPEDAQHPHVAPLRAADLSGLPAALVITAEHDPLRDEGEQYGRKLQAAGVPTVVRRYDGMIHGFWSFTGMVDATDAAWRDAMAWIRDVVANCPKRR